MQKTARLSAKAWAGIAGVSSGFTLEVHPGTLDVTVNATGSPGNA
jgi:hypothetical protein